MIKDKPIKLIQWMIIAVEKYLIRHFSKITFISDIVPADDKATLLLMNHFSFNDGAILHKVCRTLLKKEFKVMVVEAQMRSFFVLKYIGCFSVDKKSRSVVQSLNYAASLLNNPKNMVGIFPQGEVYSVHLNKIHFENGLERILNKAEKPIQIVFGATLLDYLDNFKPHARVYLQEYIGSSDVKSMENAYNQFYKHCKIKQQQLHKPPLSVIDK